jgi:hypothetical protein
LGVKKGMKDEALKKKKEEREGKESPLFIIYTLKQRKS